MKKTKKRPGRAQQVRSDRIEATLAKVLKLLEERARMLPKMPSVPVGDPTYNTVPLPTMATFTVEDVVAPSPFFDEDDQLKRAIEARRNAQPSQADVWTVLIQFFPMLKAFVNSKVQDFENQVERIVREALNKEDD